MENVLIQQQEQERKRKPLYSAYLILKKSRRHLLSLWPAQYDKVIAHHVTVQYGDLDVDHLPERAEIAVVGYVDSMDGLEALIVSVNGVVTRPDGQTYHITLSLDPSKYTPVDSNRLIAEKGYTPLYQSIRLEHVKPAIVYAKT